MWDEEESNLIAIRFMRIISRLILATTPNWFWSLRTKKARGQTDCPLLAPLLVKREMCS